MRSRPCTSGGDTKTWRSKRPGRSSAESSFSSRFDAAITTIRSALAKPSISTSSWLSVCSRSPEMSDPRRPPTASSSSMKMIAGECLRASANRRRMRAAPRPANISTNEDADCEKNCAPDSCATALASSVLPVPGGPCRSTPSGTFAPSRLKRFSSRRNSTTSCSSYLASSTPAMSSQPTSRFACGLIWTGLVFGMTFNVRHSTKTIAAMKMTVSTVAHWATKFWMRSAMLGPAATGTRTAWCRTCERELSALTMSVVCCKAPGVTGQVSVRSSRNFTLDPQDLSQGGPADLQLLGGRLARAQHALELMARYPQGFRGPRGVVALAPGEHLDGHPDRGQRQRRAMDRAWTLDHLLEQSGAGDVRGEQWRHQVRAAAVVLFGGVGGVLIAVLVRGDRLVLDAVVGGEIAAAQRHQRGHQRDRSRRDLAAHAARAPAQQGAGHRRSRHQAEDL